MKNELRKPSGTIADKVTGTAFSREGSAGHDSHGVCKHARRSWPAVAVRRRACEQTRARILVQPAYRGVCPRAPGGCVRRRTLNILLLAAFLAVAWPARGQTPPAAAAPGPRDAPHLGRARDRREDCRRRPARRGRLGARPAREGLPAEGPRRGQAGHRANRGPLPLRRRRALRRRADVRLRAVEDREAPDAAGRRHRRHRRLDRRRASTPITTS